MRTTSSLQRLDMLLAQAERFIQNGLPGEARARAREAIALSHKERPEDEAQAEQLRMRAMLAESLIRRLGREVRDGHGELRVGPEDATRSETWA